MINTKSHFRSLDEIYARAFGNYESIEKKSKEILTNIENTISTNSSIPYYVSFHLEKADNGTIKTQNGWTKYFQKHKKKGHMFPSMGDIYNMFKRIHYDIFNDTKEKKVATEFLNSINEDIDGKHTLITSTRIIYSANSYTSKIIHNYNDNRLKKIIKIKIPLIGQDSFYSILNDKRLLTDAEPFLRSYFDTEDSFEDIGNILSFISNKDLDKLNIWTPILEYRKIDQIGIANIGNKNTIFVNAFDSTNEKGICRIVSRNSKLNSGIEKYIIDNIK